jgi:hypothetical protein
METHRLRVLRLLALALLAATSLLAADLTLGTWVLNVSKSRFLPGPAFRSETRTYQQQKDGVKVTIRTVDGKGKDVTSEYLTTSDGQRHSVSGAGGPADSVALKQIDDFTAESTLLHGGMEIAKTTRVVSHDGKTMTIVYKGLDPGGEPVDYTLFFDRSK